MKMLVLVLFLCGTTSAWCDIYTWKDRRGTAHFTNSMYEIPDRYRSRAKVVDLGIKQATDTPSQQPAMSQPPALPATAVRQAIPREKRQPHRAGRKPPEK